MNKDEVDIFISIAKLHGGKVKPKDLSTTKIIFIQFKNGFTYRFIQDTNKEWYYYDMMNTKYAHTSSSSKPIVEKVYSPSKILKIMMSKTNEHT